jgi:hypothetical protein
MIIRCRRGIDAATMGPHEHAGMTTSPSDCTLLAHSSAGSKLSTVSMLLLEHAVKPVTLGGSGASGEERRGASGEEREEGKRVRPLQLAKGRLSGVFRAVPSR